MHIYPLSLCLNKMQLKLVFTLLVIITTATAISAQKARGAGEQQLLWCVGKNNAEDSALQAALDWACGTGGADCGPIQQGGPCYEASDILRTASFAFNDYFIKHGSTDDSCYFDNTASLTSIDPSFNNCKFPSSSAANNVSFAGSTAGVGPNNADMSSGSLIGHGWGWVLITIALVLTISLLS